MLDKTGHRVVRKYDKIVRRQKENTTKAWIIPRNSIEIVGYRENTESHTTGKDTGQYIVIYYHKSCDLAFIIDCQSKL